MDELDRIDKIELLETLLQQKEEENEKIIIEYQAEITRLRKILKGRCTEEEWREI